MNRKLIKDLTDAIKASDRKKTTGYDTSAVVRRIEDGTAWVHIPGGVDETPVKLTINASVGDTVQVRVSGGRAFLVGNRTAPPTDDTTAIKATYAAKSAQETAVEAKSEASEAWHYAGTAKEAAESAQDSADSAAEAAIEAWNHADDAHQAAVSANNSANNALVQLSVVEDVAGTLRWISEHGSYVPTTDTTVIEGSVYFIYENGDYIPIANPDPSANPSQEGWYVLDVTESQAKYIMAHLAVTSAGLWVLPVNQLAEHPLVDSDGDQIIDSDNNPIVDFSEDPQHASGYKVLLSGGGGSTGDFPIGLSIYNDEGELVANYGTTTTIGSTAGYNTHTNTQGFFVRNGLVPLAKYGSTTIFFEPDGVTEAAEIGANGMHVKNGKIGKWEISDGSLYCQEEYEPKPGVSGTLTTWVQPSSVDFRWECEDGYDYETSIEAHQLVMTKTNRSTGVEQQRILASLNTDSAKPHIYLNGEVIAEQGCTAKVIYRSYVMEDLYLAANSADHFSLSDEGIDAYVTGYLPISVVAIDTNHRNTVLISRFDLDMDGNVKISVRNVGNSDWSDLSITIQIGYIAVYEAP